MNSNTTKRFTRDYKLLKKQQELSFVPSRQLKTKLLTFKIIKYLQNTFSIDFISLDPGCDKVMKDEWDMDNSNKISLLNKNLFFNLFHSINNRIS